MEFYESTYFIILIPSVVIAMIFLFFWLFMKETSYDEVLAKQKKDLKLPPLKVDKKKVEKKKNKKKESQNGHLHESDSETANREFDLMDALSSEEEHVVPAPVIEAEPAVNVRERKKKDKKPPKLVTEEPAGKEINGTKPPGKKAELVPVTKQPTPPIDASGSKKKQGAKKLKNGTGIWSNCILGNLLCFWDTAFIICDVINALVPLSLGFVFIDADSSHTENAEVKFKDVVSAMRSLTLSEEEAMAVMETLKEKSRAVQEIVRKVRLLSFLEPHAPLCLGFSLRWEFIRTRLSDGDLLELLGEKQKSNLMEAKARERIAAMEKEHGVFQSKMHSSYQDAQQMQLKTQLGHLKQENSILRDAVSSATNQMESKQSGELNKLRQDCTRLVNELAEKNNKMVQEEMQKKSSEQVASQLKAQIQEAERRVEEAETYLRSRLAECDVIQQDMQGKLLTKESEIQTLHSKFTDTMVSNQQLEQRILQLMEASQKANTRLRVYDKITCYPGGLMILLLSVRERDQKIRTLEEQLQREVAKVSSNLEDYTVSSFIDPGMQEKEDKIKTVEELLEAGLIEMANKEEELRVCAAPVCLPALRCPVPPLCACWLCFAVSDPLCVFSSLSDKDAQIEALREEAESLKSALEQQRKKNNDLREKNWKAMDALASTEKMLQNKVNKTAKVTPLSARREASSAILPRATLHPTAHVWGGGMGPNADTAGGGLNQNTPMPGALHHPEGILQRLQRSVEEEEGRWKVKVEESQKELKEVCGVSVCVCLCLCLCVRSTKALTSLQLKDLLTELQLKLDGSYSEASRQNEELALVRRLRAQCVPARAARSSPLCPFSPPPPVCAQLASI
uniref:Kinectin 1 n=1 Tax=Leptobrachium leishanense TaxID=445787 RepID=A0A8C5WIE9_9ANUR